MKSLQAISFVLGLVALAGCESNDRQAKAPADAGADLGEVRLDTAAIEEALVGNSLSGAGTGSSYVLFFPDLGSFRADYDGVKDTGTWEVRDDLYCRRFRVLAGRVERCFALYRQGDLVIWKTAEGREVDRTDWYAGNPKDL